MGTCPCCKHSNGQLVSTHSDIPVPKPSSKETQAFEETQAFVENVSEPESEPKQPNPEAANVRTAAVASAVILSKQKAEILSSDSTPLYDVDIQVTEEKVDGDDTEGRLIRIALSSPGSSELEFLDEFLIQHKESSLLREVLITLSHCFGADALQKGFIHFDDATNHFSFAATSKSQRTLSNVRICTLPKNEFSKEQAIRQVLDANKELLSDGDVTCINGHVIHDTVWQLEVTLSRPAGLCDNPYMYKPHRTM